MKGFEDTFSFLFDYVELIFSKGWHWLIILGVILLLMATIFNGCSPNDIKPLQKNDFNESNMSNSTNFTSQTSNLTSQNGNNSNISTGRNNTEIKNNNS